MTWEPISATAVLLASFASQPTPWLSIEANSDQRQPVYLGTHPAELTRIGERRAPLVLPAEMRDAAEIRLKQFAKKRKHPAFQAEIWPAQDDAGKRTWVYARWRETPSSAWQWMEESKKEDDDAFFPKTYRADAADEADLLFKDFLKLDDLYAKPLYGDCVWTDASGARVYGAWLPLAELKQISRDAIRSHAVCRWLPQPARLDGAPYSMVASYHDGALEWPSEVTWSDDRADAARSRPRVSRHRKNRRGHAHLAARSAASLRQRIAAWPADFENKYKADVLALDGEAEATFASDGHKTRFMRKNSADGRNQLLELVAYLEARYAKLGIRTWRQSFEWRGIPQANLVAVLPGSAPDHEAAPVLMADHFDTAFCEDIFADTHDRVSAPGADDNVSATAALLRAAELLSREPHARDIWLVHLTGEEFPGDDLGARALVSKLLADRQRISGLVLMDMIGWHKKRDGLFQISAGESPASQALGELALAAASEIAPKPMVPVLRPRFDDYSYLFNTDGIVFSDTGMPVVLFNEHLNELENLNRKGYHQTTDTSAKMDFAFASTIAKVVIQTALSLANP
jgi:hypothetical protein